jgi:hypothetical protein
MMGLNGMPGRLSEPTMDDVPGRLSGNAYWAAVKELFAADPAAMLLFPGSLRHRLMADGVPLGPPDWVGGFANVVSARQGLAERFSFTITAPDTVAFVVGHVVGRAVIDPLASTGWWASLLAAAGVDVYASDLQVWPGQHVPVGQADAVDVVRAHPGRILLLGWPPYASPVGAGVVDAYRGDRIIYLGEVDGNCGDRRLMTMLDEEWRVSAVHEPATWPGLHDTVVVFDRATVVEGRP